jgi:hypothetical protein
VELLRPGQNTSTADGTTGRSADDDSEDAAAGRPASAEPQARVRVSPAQPVLLPPVVPHCPAGRRALYYREFRMAEKTVIRAIETIRRIRDQQAEELRGKSDDEIIAFFRKAGEEAREDAAKRLAGTPQHGKSA